MSVNFSAEKSYTYLKGYAMGAGWSDTVEALSFARKMHKDQRRKSGDPYIIHPLMMACHAVAIGIHEDVIVAAALLHDVVEDCGVKVKDLPVSADTKDAVRRLTHVKGDPLGSYYREIGESRVASIVKLLDRCDNVSTMAGVFSVEKTKQYIEETRQFVLPLLQQTKENYPEDTNALFILKYHITSVINGLDACLASSAAPLVTSLSSGLGMEER